MPDPYYLVLSSTSQRVLIGAFEADVSVGNVASRIVSDTIRTTHFGSLALSDELDGIVTAAYHIHGLALYCAASGKERWRRKDLKKIQSLNLSIDGTKAFAGFDRRPLSVIDLHSGDTVQQLRGVRALHESPFDEACFIDGLKPRLCDRLHQRLHSIRRTTFAFLSIAFGPGVIVTTEAGGPVRCIDIVSGNEQWRYTPAVGSHVLELCYRAHSPAFLGIEWPFEEGGGKKILEFSPANGCVREVLEIGEVQHCFALSGRIAITSKGHAIDTETGAVRAAWSADET